MKDLASRLTTGPFWQLVRPAMTEGEVAVHYAHLRCVRGTEDVTGTLFLTSRQLLWRSVDPRDPEGSGFDVQLEDVLGVDRPARFAAYTAFRVVTEHAARPVDTYFFPHRRNEAERHLCTEMFTFVEDAWRDRRAFPVTA